MELGDTMKLDQIDLVCADMDKTLAFYRLLGVAMPRVWRTKSGAHHGHVALPGGLSLQFNSPALARVYERAIAANAAAAATSSSAFRSRRAARSTRPMPSSSKPVTKA